jgi:ABC-type multidrug transport system fused ATPase/permease subunit
MTSASGSNPPLSSIPRFVLWQAARQPWILAAGILFGVVWMLCQAVWPYLLGKAIDEGIRGGVQGVLGWCAGLLGLALAQAGAGVLRHRTATASRLQSSLGIAQLIGHHSADTGRAITARTASGEIVSTVSSDSLRFGEMFDVIARLSGGIVAYLTVSGIMLFSSPQLGLAVLIGLPALGLLMFFLVKPLGSRQSEWRHETGRLTTLGADTVAGLRVLRGIGGEEEFVARYSAQSQQVRKAGVRVAGTQSWLDGLQVALPGLFLAFLVWFGAHLALDGVLSAGELVALYGYAAFLVLPLRTAVEAAQVFTRGVVAARRVLDVLNIRPSTVDRERPHPAPPSGADIVDVASGVVVRPGKFTAIVAPNPDTAAAVASRLGRFDDTLHRDAPVLWGGIDHTSVPVREVRRRIVVSDADPHLFAGPLIDGLDVRSDAQPNRESTDTGQIRRVGWALDAAGATETVDALPGGLRERVPERGRSFSGGQRQRLSLARALLTDAEVLVLVEPTSAVDAHTEALIAERVRRARQGRTTVVVTSSPLLLDRMDVVIVLRNGKVAGEGNHVELLRRQDEVGKLYRSVVARTMSAAEPPADADLEAAWTGSIETLWTGAVQAQPKPPSPGASADEPEGGDDAAADR